MKGIRKRMTTGFMSIVVMLFISGMISYFELSRLSLDTEEILNANTRNIELAREMLVAADAQNRAFIHLAVLGRAEYDSLCRSSMTKIENTLKTALDEAVDPAALDSLSQAVSEMRLLSDAFLAYEREPEMELEPDFEDVYVDVEWYDNDYQSRYKALTSAIGKFMTSTQSSLAPRTEQLKTNAYRAVTPVLISLVVVIAIVLMFHFFVNTYCVNPILRMNESLGQYLSFRIPFKMKSECRDEMAELKDKIESLTNSRSNQPKP